MLALLTTVSTVFGDELKVENVTISNSGKSVLLVNFYQDERSSISGIDFTISLPEGVEFVNEGGPVFKTGAIFKGSDDGVNILADGKLTAPLGGGDPIRGTKGMVLAVLVQPSATLTPGTTLTGGVIKGKETTDGYTVTNLPDESFSIEVTDRAVLDENSPFIPSETLTGKVNLLLKRTINADTWSTIYLPFKVTRAKVESAFGTDVKYAKFTGWSTTGDNTDISIDFTSETEALDAGVPYIIKLSKSKTEFTFDNVTINDAINTFQVFNTNFSYYDDDEEEDVFAKATMTGVFNLQAMNANDMYLHNNYFYYAPAGQVIKGFRAKFRFQNPYGADYLISKGSNTRAMFTIDGKSIGDGSGNTTGIESTTVQNSDGKIYSMTGQYLGERESMKSLPKGVYIIDGKKVINK